MRWNTLHSFYTSTEWTNFKQQLMLERIDEEGQLRCEHCGAIILNAYDCIPHHCNIELTLANVNDYSISLNPDNIQLVHFKCHNKIHERFGKLEQKAYLIWGSPCAGKSSFVKKQSYADDLIVDMDSIWQCISNSERYVKANRLKANAFAVRDCLLDMIRMREGKWRNAWVIMGMPLRMERKRIADRLGCDSVHIDTSMDECIVRSKGRPKEWEKYIEEYWDRFQPDTPLSLSP